jgi:ABC-type Fe3+ transport system substrate-binding protein
MSNQVKKSEQGAALKPVSGKGFKVFFLTGALISAAGFMHIASKSSFKTSINSSSSTGSFFAARPSQQGPLPQPREAVLSVQGSSLQHVRSEKLQDALATPRAPKAPVASKKASKGTDWAAIISFARNLASGKATQKAAPRRTSAFAQRPARQSQFGGQLHTVRIKNRVLRRVTATKAIGQLRASQHFAQQGVFADNDEARMQATQDSFEQQGFVGSRIASDVAHPGNRAEGDLVILPMISVNRTPRIPSMEMMR